MRIVRKNNLLQFNLTKENFLLFAMNSYNNPHCYSISDFTNDMYRFRYLKRLFRKYLNGGKFNDKLILNHVISIQNVFGNEVSVRMLFFEMEEEIWSSLKTVLIFLNILPKYVLKINNINIKTDDIEIDSNVVSILRKIGNKNE